MTADERREHERALARKRNARYRASHPDRSKVYSREWRRTHRDEKRAASKAYRSTHREQAKAYRASQNTEEVRAYHKAYYENNRDRLSDQKKAYHAAHQEEARARAKRYRETNQDRIKAYWDRNKERTAIRNAAQKRANRARYTAIQRQRDAAKICATPAWADRQAMVEVYCEAARRTRVTGVQHDVDHVVPLKGKTVCGLHVEYNLQILTHIDNVKKSNKFSVARAA